MRLFFTALFTFSFPFCLIGQVKVIFTDESGKAIEGVSVECASGYTAVSTDAGIVELTESSGTCTAYHISFNSRSFETSNTHPDTTFIQLLRRSEVLPEVVVQGYQESVRLRDVPGAYGYLSRQEMSSFSDVTPVSAFNTLPGVRMEQRSPSSYRVNIRGSTLRSPFGVRNVKVYWNQIPLTEPTGNTPLNMLDISGLGDANIIRGPSGSIYGAGNGGVILFENTLPATPSFSSDVNVAAGSFGMRRFRAGFSHKSKSNALRITVSSHKSDGYREHSAFDRKNLMLTGQTDISPTQKLRYNIAYGDLNYQLPGGLTEEQRDSDPEMARPIAVSQNSSLDQKYLFAGIEHDISWAGWENQTTFFYSTSNKKNPFITNYEFEDLTGGGLRTRFSTQPGGEDSPFYLTAGGEWQWGSADADNFGNSQGNPDTLRYSDQNSQFTGFEFLKVSYETKRLRISVAGSFNHLNYDFDRVKDAALDSSYILQRSFSTVFTPRIGIFYDAGKFAVHASYSEGFSPPVLDEIRTSDARINTSLNAEQARSVEVGLRGRFFGDIVALDLNLFYMRLENTIVSRIDEDGTSTFFNSGTTRQQGMEVLAGFRLLEQRNHILRYAYLKSSFTWYHFRFGEYIREAGGANVDYGGNELTGTPEFTLANTLVLHFGRSVKAQLNYQHVSSIPLNDANTVYSESYDLLQLQASWTIAERLNHHFEIYAGVDNLLNQSYSLGNDLNAFGSRYFNPAAERNYFAGIRIRFGQ